MIEVSLGGCTGSIGKQTVEVIEKNPDIFSLVAIAAHSSVDSVVEIARQHNVKTVAMTDERAAARLASILGSSVDVVGGANSLSAIGKIGDVVVNAAVGFAGLDLTVSALESGKKLGLANKESLVVAGPLVKQLLQKHGGKIIPIDSEHSAIFQCLKASGQDNDDQEVSQKPIDQLVLSSSGGPFRGRSFDSLQNVTPQEALKHPTWSMGPKISVDSSTLFNKGIEVIEAHELFDVPYERIEVVIHPQSIVHSMVTFSDGSTIAQLSKPDMRLAIGYALGYPRRLETPFGKIDWREKTVLEFEPPDRSTFRCLDLAVEAGRVGKMAPCWLNAANEVAVESFLSTRVTWGQISSIIEEVLSSYDGSEALTVEDVVEADRLARERAFSFINNF